MTPTPVWSRPAGLSYGGDYNPEQWSEETWAEDAELMRAAGVTLVTVGVFAWAELERGEGNYDFAWLDRVLDLLHRNGIAVDLATATASPPPWFSHAHPESLPETVDGRRMWPGSRQAYCPSSAAYRDAACRLVEQLAKRYADHPALAMWHVNNEYADHVPQCYCPTSAEAFRHWLQRRYVDLDTLNNAWGTAFWSQRYTAWDEIIPPRLTPSFANPTQQVDFYRFSSDELLDCFRSERDVLRRLSPNIPVTTNFMAPRFKELDYWTWAAELDVVSNDHYLRGEEADTHVDVALAADLTRSLAGGEPWLLMEHSTSAVNWQPRNLAKTSGQMRRNSLQHVARGADGAMFFQWRASRAGAEKFHSAMLPHAGTDTKVWQEVSSLGSDLATLGELRGSTVEADVALVWDWPSWWALELDAHPTVDLRFFDQMRSHHAALWRAGITTDFVPPAGDLSGYRMLVVPNLYMVDDTAAANLAEFVREGGTLVVGCFSGIVDENDHVRLGGYPGAFRSLLGVRIEEFFPLAQDATVRLTDGSTGSVWSEMMHPVTAEVVASYVDGDLAGRPAMTCHDFGAGRAWYVGTCLDDVGLDRLLSRTCEQASVGAPVPPQNDVEVVRRVGADASYLFVLNHSGKQVAVPALGRNLLGGVDCVGSVLVPAGDVAVVKEQPDGGRPVG